MADSAYYQQQQQQQQQQSTEHDQRLTPTPSKADSKPQATFLTKLYALLERPENHHMIRWDAEGKHIIVERPEQLALHVLPSIYRQSRFASFSRQLNIYGFMRKVNLRNVDPSIDDPDASTWSHPTLDRNSPPEVVANFKRRVPPRLPKPRKRPPDPGMDPSSSLGVRSNGLGIPLTVPSSVSISSPQSSYQRGRSRGFSAPSPYSHPPPAPNVATSGQWAAPHPYSQRHALPPLTVPTEHHHSHYSNQQQQHHHHHHQMHSSIPPISGPEESQNSAFSPTGYSAQSSHYSSYAPPSSHAYSYNHDSSSSWGAPPSSTSGGQNSLSSLLNPSSNYSGRPSIQTSYLSHHSAYSIGANQSPVSVSPDSRPTTGYSVASSLSSIAYEPSNVSHEYDSSRPTSSQRGRPITPLRGHSPTYPKNAYSSSLIMRRDRRHSHAMSPYPSPYDSDGRPMTAPGHPDSPVSTDPGSISRVKSFGGPVNHQQPAQYGYHHHMPAPADFAYSTPANGSATSLLQPNGLPAPAESADRTWIPPAPMQQGQDTNMDEAHILRPSTSASSISAASQGSTESTGHTPPSGMDPAPSHPGGEDYNRFLSNYSHPMPKQLSVDA